MYSTKNIKVEVKMMSPSEARAIRTCMAYSRQRREDIEHVKTIAEYVTAGTFLEGSTIRICVTPDGTGHLVNGNHTLEAISRGAVAVPVTVIYHKVDSEDEMHRVYAREDSFRPRSNEARLKAIGMDTEFGLSGRWLDTMSAAALILQNNLVYSGGRSEYVRSIDNRADALKDWKVELNKYVENLPKMSKTMGHIARRSALVACGAYVYRYQPSTACEFFTGLLEDDGLGATDPRKRLLEWCRTQRYVGSGINEHIMRFRSAWNAFFRGENLSRLYEAAAGTPILGTPMNAPTRTRKSPSPIVLGTASNGAPTGFVAF
jgi:hypothetical protein